MPSPVAHALAGIATGWIVNPAAAGDRREVVRRSLLFAAAATAPDLDLLAGAHSGPTHGLGAAMIAGAVVWLCLRLAESPQAARGAAAAALAYASHTLLDWLGTDSSPPIGIMALWPFSRDYYESGLHVFMAISRRYWLPEFWTYNLRALVRELIVFVPILAIVFWYQRE